MKLATEAIVRDVKHIAIHDQRYVQVAYSPVDEQGRILQARIGLESTFEALKPGHRVVVHSLMNVVIRIELSGDSDD
ncbi:hypothetical protein MK139_04575 [bacterium]|nr:hypothetical protein [Gemmatimonadota bacterium]MCH2663595.1 hypothetical protein [bacterium]HCK08496.1 hypothetical protein [Candidatus Latescibacterota bacterium]